MEANVAEINQIELNLWIKFLDDCRFGLNCFFLSFSVSLSLFLRRTVKFPCTERFSWCVRTMYMWTKHVCMQKKKDHSFVPYSLYTLKCDTCMRYGHTHRQMSFYRIVCHGFQEYDLRVCIGACACVYV